MGDRARVEVMITIEIDKDVEAARRGIDRWEVRACALSILTGPIPQRYPDKR